MESRFVWAVPSTAGRAATRELLGVLDTHRLDAGNTSLGKFIRGRRTEERKVLQALVSLATKSWKKESGNAPTEDEMRQFLRLIHIEVYDFESGTGMSAWQRETSAPTSQRNPKTLTAFGGSWSTFYQRQTNVAFVSHRHHSGRCSMRMGSG